MALNDENIAKCQQIVEKCLRSYLTQEETIEICERNYQIEPSVTRYVWSQLNELNADFFKSYDLLLRTKQQVISFNYLLNQDCMLELKKKS